EGMAMGWGGRALAVPDGVAAERPAFGVALAHVYPASSERPRSGPVEGVRGNREVSPTDAGAVAERAVAALRIERGPTYTQLRLGPDGPQVMEVAARLGGGHDAELVEAALGIDLDGRAIRAAPGQEIGDV